MNTELEHNVRCKFEIEIVPTIFIQLNCKVEL